MQCLTWAARMPLGPCAQAAAAVGAVQTDSEAVELSKAANMKFVDPDQVYEGLPRVEDEGDEL